MEYFCCYNSYRNKTAKLSDQEVGRLFRALMDYNETGERQELTGRENIAFDFIADDIDRAKVSYEARCALNAQNGKSGGRPKNRTDTKKPNGFQKTESPQNKDKDKDKDKDKPKEKARADKPHAFSPPTVEEVARYCAARKNGVDAQAFVDFYASKGWRVGAQPMRDWMASVRTWERRRAQERGAKGYAQHAFADAELDGMLADLDGGAE